ncbi:Putative ATP synthase subunit f, mitochondrial [Eumeta japonica]|uniref:ATP synthase subunit f, mitochondrial n=1 Tax=Eumeta variegata TaxID=151549 RepID=A0A4C1SGP8_EUMVA|nr:Putative ATP synthase subunit f, mitochondrial [Eumeta japonica]
MGFGDYPAEYNPKVHGPYDPTRFTAKPYIKDKSDTLEICRKCFDKLRDFNEFFEFVALVHKEQKISLEGFLPDDTGDCGKTFINNSGLKDHFMKHHEPEENLPYGCDECPRRFSRKIYWPIIKLNIYQNGKITFCKICSPPKAFILSHVTQKHQIYVMYVLKKYVINKHLKSTYVYTLKKADHVSNALAKVTQSNKEDPTHICLQCWEKIKDFHEFYEAVENHKLFQQNVAIKQERELLEENLMQVEYEIDVNLNDSHNAEFVKENPLEAERANNDIETGQVTDIDHNANSSSEYALSEASEEPIQ